MKGQVLCFLQAVYETLQVDADTEVRFTVDSAAGHHESRFRVLTIPLHIQG